MKEWNGGRMEKIYHEGTEGTEKREWRKRRL